MDELKDKDIAETSKERASDAVTTEDRYETQIVGDVQFGSVVIKSSNERVSDYVDSGDYEKTPIVDSAEIASDCLAEETPNVDSVNCDAQVAVISKETSNDQVETVIVDFVGSGTLETSKETAGYCGASRDCEKTQIVSDIQSGSTVVEVWKEIVSNRVACADSEKTPTVKSVANAEGPDMHVADGGKTFSKHGNSSSDEAKEVGLERDTKNDAVEGRSCNGSDVAIGTLPVDDVNARDAGAVKLSEDGISSPGGSKEGDTKDLVVGSDEAAGSGLKIITKSEIETLESSEGKFGKFCKEKSVDVSVRDEYVDRGVLNVAADLNSSGIRLLENDGRVENSVTQVSCIDKSQLVDEDLLQESETEDGCVLYDGVRDPEIDTKAVHSSTVIEDPNVETRVVEEPLVVENDEKDPIVNMISESFAGHTHVSSMEDEDITNMEDLKFSPEPNQLNVVADVATEYKKVEKLSISQFVSCNSVSNSDSGLKEGDHLQKDGGWNGNKTNVAEEEDTDSEERTAKRSVKSNCVTYQLPPDDDGEFKVFNLVWGKVRSHPWWPGQIFDPSDASEKAMKYQKKDCFLVAYFGDRTFAWNDSSLLKPFRSNFSQVEKQSNSEAFHNAVDCALEEVSRRVEFGLACSCIPEAIFDKIKHQIVENAGICEESSIQNGVEKSLSADLFEPGKLVDYMKELAQFPVNGADKLQIVIAKSQLLAYYRFKGFSELPEIRFCGDLLENDDILKTEDVKISSDQQTQRRSYRKRKHNLKDNLNPKKKEKNTTELMGDSWDSVDGEFGSDEKAQNKLVSHSSGKKRKGSESVAKSSPVSVPKPSFKIGECIRRVASLMTGSPSILKSDTQMIDGSSNQGIFEDESEEIAKSNTEYSSLDELLLQLQLAALDPLKGYSFLTVIVSFFSDFRNSAIMEQREKVLGEKRQQSGSGSPDETFEFHDMNDTYWTDRVIQNGSEEKPPRKSRKRASGDPNSNSKPLSKSNSKKRNSEGNHSPVEEKPAGYVEEKPIGYVDENSPAELVMHFPVVDSVPSESRLIKMFKRFGPLKEIETEIDRDTNRARVVFKKSCDAETAYSSATKFNIFGSMLVNYQLNYAITMPFKTEPVVTLQGDEDATVFLQSEEIDLN